MIKDTAIKIRMNEEELQTIAIFYSMLDDDSHIDISDIDIINIFKEIKTMYKNNFNKSEIITQFDDTIYLSVE